MGNGGQLQSTSMWDGPIMVVLHPIRSRHLGWRGLGRGNVEQTSTGKGGSKGGFGPSLEVVIRPCDLGWVP